MVAPRFSTDYVPCVDLLLLKPWDLDAAMLQVPAMFTSTGFKDGFGSSDVERIARSLNSNLQGSSDSDLIGVQGTSEDNKTAIAKLVTNLLGPSATWDSLTAEQVNVAIATGLVARDPSSNNALVLTVNGATYLRSKTTADTQPPSGVPPAEPSDDKALWDAMKLFYEGGGIAYADYAEWDSATSNRPIKDNNIIGPNGFYLLANADVNSHIWDECGLGRLSTEQRQKLIDAAKTICSFGDWVFDSIPSEDKRFDSNEIRAWLEIRLDTWYGDMLRHQIGQSPEPWHVKDRFKDPNYKPTIVYDPNAFLITPETQNKLDKACETWFGKKFSDMNNDEKAKALHLLTDVYRVFYYTPPEYTDVFDPVTGEKTRTVINPGQLYLRPGAVVPGESTIGNPAERIYPEVDDDDDYGSGTGGG